MTGRARVKPTYLSANGIWNHFTGRKRYTIRCGACAHSWREKVPFSTGDVASALCPSCGAQNVWSHAEFERDYNAQTQAQRASRS
jgi:hypothetical protein